MVVFHQVLSHHGDLLSGYVVCHRGGLLREWSYYGGLSSSAVSLQ